MFVGAFLIIPLMVLLFTGLIIGLGVGIYIASCRSLAPTANRLASYLFSSMAVSSFIGLSLSCTPPSSPDFQGEVLCFMRRYSAIPAFANAMILTLVTKDLGMTGR